MSVMTKLYVYGIFPVGGQCVSACHNSADIIKKGKMKFPLKLTKLHTYVH